MQTASPQFFAVAKALSKLETLSATIDKFIEAYDEARAMSGRTDSVSMGIVSVTGFIEETHTKLNVLIAALRKEDKLDEKDLEIFKARYNING